MTAPERFVECVPNVSEGADARTLAAISDAIDGTLGAWLLDRTSDIDHARSVFTLAGTAPAITEAVRAAMAEAIDRIDMRRQAGQHPRIGAVDVIPFVPLGETAMEDCVVLAREFADSVADTFDLPVYLYGEAALRPGRRLLATIRKPGFEGLEEAMAAPDGAPDRGPRRPHPTAGATAIGARPLLIAWNIQLETTDVTIARHIAGRIRERDGGLAAVQSLGLELGSLGCVQVSMNVLDHARTPLWRVWEEVVALAVDERVKVRDSELIGLVPRAALLDVAEHIGTLAGRPLEDRVSDAARWLQIRDFQPSMVLESRLASARGRP